MQFNEQEQALFDALVPKISAQMAANDSVKAAKDEAKYNKKTNPEGLPAARVSIVATCAKIEAEAQYEEFAERAGDIQATYERLSGYNK